MTEEYKALMARLKDVALRTYQTQTVLTAVEKLTSTHSSLMIELPTGSGKTITGLSIVALVAQKLGYTRIGWSCMRRDLLLQASRECAQKNFPIEIIPISMFASSAPEVDILVIDEAHHDATKSMAHIHKITNPKKTLGLSATPYRPDGAELLFEEFVSKYGIRELIRQGYIAKPDHYTISDWTPADVTATYLRDPERFGKSVMYFTTLVDCHEACGILQKAGISTEVISAGTDRERQLAEFASGYLRVLVNVGILTEGFDSPDLETVFARPTGSSILSTQMAGRVLRMHPGLTKKIVECSRNSFPFTAVADARNQYLWIETDKSWKQQNPDHAQILKTIRNADVHCVRKIIPERSMLEIQMLKDSRG